MNKYEIVGKLRSIDYDSPIDSAGYYGVILKPKWMPKWLAYMLRKRFVVHYAWMNKNGFNRSMQWWIYPSGDKFLESGERAESILVKPFLWCTIKVPYKTKITFLGGHPFNCKVEDPKGECAEAK